MWMEESGAVRGDGWARNRRERRRSVAKMEIADAHSKLREMEWCEMNMLKLPDDPLYEINECRKIHNCSNYFSGYLFWYCPNQFSTYEYFHMGSSPPVWYLWIFSYGYLLFLTVRSWFMDDTYFSNNYKISQNRKHKNNEFFISSSEIFIKVTKGNNLLLQQQ